VGSALFPIPTCPRFRSTHRVSVAYYVTIASAFDTAISLILRKNDRHLPHRPPPLANILICSLPPAHATFTKSRIPIYLTTDVCSLQKMVLHPLFFMPRVLCSGFFSAISRTSLFECLRSYTLVFRLYYQSFFFLPLGLFRGRDDFEEL